MNRLSDLLSLPLDCGGRGRCGRCKVQVTGELSPLSPEESALLTQEEIAAGYRLACMTQVLGDYTVHSLPQEPLSIQLAFSPASFQLEPAQGVGAAVDIGTTTLAVYWYDLSDGSLIQQRAIPNPQRIFGADIISRMEKAMNGQLPQLTACIRQAIQDLLPDCPARLVLTGNTTMLYLLCGYPPDSLAAAPFQMDHSFGFQKNKTILPPCLSAYVGADMVTAIIASGLWKDGHVTAEKPTLLLDAGTNGEMVLAAGGRLYGCATAAGPAFEGSHISCGLPSVPGAICRVAPDFSCETIGGLPAKGYCGSGILDLTANLLSAGSLDETGYLEDWPCDDLPPLTQKDIREIQLAKAAVAAGCETLLREASVTRLDTIFLAGGFGSQLSPVSAQAIGLIPPARQIIPLGNGAGQGAAMLLLRPSLLEEMKALKQQFQLIELANHPHFSEAFIHHMYFPEAPV